MRFPIFLFAVLITTLSLTASELRNPPSDADYVSKPQTPQQVIWGCGPGVRKIVFICDGSASVQAIAATVKDELDRAVSSLHPFDLFDVIFYRDGKAEAFKTDMVKATPAAKRNFRAWMDGVRTEGKSDPVVALETAMKLKPDRLYFITGPADFPAARGIKAAIDRGNKDQKIKVSTILFVADAAERAKNESLELLLKDVAAKSLGRFRVAEVDSIVAEADSINDPTPAECKPAMEVVSVDQTVK